MGRVSWKTKIIPKNLYLKIIKKKDFFLTKSFSRNQKFVKDFENLELEIHNGKTFQKLEIKSSFLGYSTGDFVLTRKNADHKKLSKKKR
jgi:ribosomal protein S19